MGNDFIISEAWLYTLLFAWISRTNVYQMASMHRLFAAHWRYTSERTENIYSFRAYVYHMYPCEGWVGGKRGWRWRKCSRLEGLMCKGEQKPSLD